MTKLQRSKISSSGHQREKVIPWLLAGFAVALYVHTLRYGFVMDDRAVIEQNQLVQQGLAGIPRLLTTFYWQGYWHLNAGLYRPLSLVMFAAEWQLSPNNPFLHHLVNVGLYALCAFGLFVFLRQLFPQQSVWYAATVTALFVAHPAHTEVVANIKSRDELLAFLFFIGAGLALLRNRSRFSDMALATLCFLFALLSKESGLLFLPVLAWVVWLKQQDIRATWWRMLPLAIVAVGWLAWHTYVIRQAGSPVVPYTYQDNSLIACQGMEERLGTGLTLLGRYMLNSLWPFALSYDYSYRQVPCVSVFSFPAVLVAVGALSLLGFAWHYRKTHPAFKFGMFFFFITIALATNLLILIGTTFADRLLFTPLLGLLLAAVYLLFELLQVSPARQLGKVATGVVLVVLMLYGYRTLQRSTDWSSNEVLLRHDSEVAVNSARVYFNYASYLLNHLSANEQEKAQQLQICIRQLHQALDIDPDDAATNLNLGTAYYRTGNYVEALVYLRAAHHQAPADQGVLANYADALFRNGRYDSAIVYYHRLFATGTGSAENYNMCGTAYFNLKDYTEAEAIFRKGRQLYPTYYTLWLNGGNALAASGRLDEAIALFQEADRLHPADRTILQHLAMAYAAMGDNSHAQQYQQQISALPR